MQFSDFDMAFWQQGLTRIEDIDKVNQHGIDRYSLQFVPTNRSQLWN